MAISRMMFHLRESASNQNAPFASNSEDSRRTGSQVVTTIIECDNNCCCHIQSLPIVGMCWAMDPSY